MVVVRGRVSAWLCVYGGWTNGGGGVTVLVAGVVNCDAAFC